MSLFLFFSVPVFFRPAFLAYIKKGGLLDFFKSKGSGMGVTVRDKTCTKT